MPPLLPYLSEALEQTYGMKPAGVDVLLLVALACLALYGWFLWGCDEESL